MVPGKAGRRDRTANGNLTHSMIDMTTIREKIDRGVPLEDQDATELYSSSDLLGLGMLAQSVRQRVGASACSLISVRRIRYSNVCRNRCRHCDGSFMEGAEGAYTATVPEVVDWVGEAVRRGVDQIQLTGGSNPEPPYDYYMEMVGAVRAAFPEIHIQGFAPEQLANIAKRAALTFTEVLRDLKNAGLSSLLEDGADIFDPTIRTYLCPAKCTGGTWLQIMREAHELGMFTGASMLYGHLEGPETKTEHLSRLRDLQDETGGFTFFAPRAFRRSKRVRNGLVGGLEDLREFAVSRVFLQNFPHVRCYANDLGMKTTQIALQFGVDSVVVLVRDGEPLDDGMRADVGLPNATQLRDLLERVCPSVCPAHLNHQNEIAAEK